MSEIKFGTDGWRAVIADGYTFENLETVARATAAWVGQQEDGDGSVVVAHDTRFQGEAFARFVARVFASNGVRVRLADGFATTPAVSWKTADGGHTAGIVITASHNPPAYNGFKIKAHFGGPATPDMIAAVEAGMGSLGEAAPPRPYDDLVGEGLIETFDLQTEYVDLLRERIDVDAIKEAGTKVAYDAMYGAGQGVVTELLGKTRVVELHHELNPGMHGQAPEPIEKNLDGLLKAVIDKNAAAGLATDGDADRIGLVDEEGTFVDSHSILALLVKYLHEEKGLKGDVVKTFSTTDMLDKMGQKYGLTVQTTPIGFKYIGPKMVEGDVLVGGEESGGMAVKGHIYERDGLYIGLTVIEMMVKRERTLSGLVRELSDEFGPHFQARNDLHTTDARKQAVLKELAEDGLKTVDGQPVVKTETLDGFKFRVENGWLLFRPSGTEPVLRVYSEADSQEAADALVAWGVAYVNEEVPAE
ncbi:phosphoglucomutase/phosphomannomutase family protein [Rubrivirga litoralis]|uniref:Phosphoglucomutase/phosphomannomutase family protein n=1 Tax=Rubrivirga litoralis TaxID=3075598 RepID=A0ABU3BQ04_9BACT|nr:phosphoglucomutase/phosphomannomutase family protein [Rubrivirga sp. F394]MDT0631358.1 phosphoglucomutase/phosphomannomutase family protein [Rubrivirga sp. F394]